MDIYAPPIPDNTPAITNAILFVLKTLIPTDFAASGFSPTARILNPKLVLNNKNQITNAEINDI